jgi:integrase
MSSLYVLDYEQSGKKSAGKARKSAAHLEAFFGGWKVTHITFLAVREYVEHRRRMHLANATINRELSALRRMFRLAVRAKLIGPEHVPDIPKLQEAPPRQGFFEPDQFQAVLRHLPLPVKPIAQFAYETGWRLREILGLQRRQVNLGEGSARLDPGSTKNRDGRLVYLSPPLLAVLRSLDTATRELERQRGITISSMFHHRRGKPITTFTRSWRTACKKAGVPGMLFHDLRRTAIRNLVRAGVREGVVMQISGHRTRSVFERYNITSESDLREAARRLASYGQPATPPQAIVESSTNGHVADPRTLPDGRAHSS